MLKQRLLTIIVLVPLIIWAIFSMSPRAFSIVSALLCLWIGWEWAYVCAVQSKLLRLLFALLCAGICCLAWFKPVIAAPILQATLVFWVVALFLVINFALGKGAAWLNNIIFRLCAGALVIPALWISLSALRNLHATAALLMYALLVVWLSDSAAYVTGRLWGKHKLAARVSPKKSWEGVYGALFACVVLSFIGHFWFSLSWPHTLTLLCMTLLSGAWSIVGDLFESVLKRRADIKDSGSLLPGHGGILDRTDALLAGLPWFTMGVLLLHI